MILGIFFLIIIMIGVFSLFRKSREEAGEEKRAKERLRDETIYVPETGTRLTREEAEKGHFIAHDHLRRKTEAELVQNYSWEQLQVERIRNHAIEAGYAFPAGEVEDTLIEVLGNCTFTAGYSDVQLYFTVQVDEASFLFTLLVDYQLVSGGRDNQCTEWHLAAAKHMGSSNAGPDAADWQKKAIAKELGALGAAYTVEPGGEYVILKLYRHATLDDAQQIIRILKNAKESDSHHPRL